jgi:hypothetical protein
MKPPSAMIKTSRNANGSGVISKIGQQLSQFDDESTVLSDGEEKI